MFTLEVIVDCNGLIKDDLEGIVKSLSPDNVVSGLKIDIYVLHDSKLAIYIEGLRIGSVKAAFNDIFRVLNPLLELFKGS